MKNNLKQLISINQINIEALAEKTQIGRTTIYQIMNGKTVPNVEYALRLSKFFNVLVEEMFIISNEKSHL